MDIKPLPIEFRTFPTLVLYGLRDSYIHSYKGAIYFKDYNAINQIINAKKQIESEIKARKDRLSAWVYYNIVELSVGAVFMAILLFTITSVINSALYAALFGAMNK